MHLWILFSRKIPYPQRKRPEDDCDHHHADRSYRSCDFKYVSACTESPVYASRKGIQCVSYFPRYRQSGFSHLLLSPAGRFPAYQEPFPLWTESPSFALISEIPWNLMFTNTLHYERQNVFFTLFLGYLAFCAIEYFKDKRLIQLLCILGLLVVSIFLKADYGWRGYIFLLIMYYMRNDKPGQAILGSCWLYYEWRACFAFLSINLYNGERGFIHGKAAKYFFYWFYPVHIMGLVILRQILFLS